jgi:alpha-beta hydrolase superfamily lysophospholipase
MHNFKQVDYSVLDRPEVLMFLFHPRRETGTIAGTGTGLDLLIPVEEDIRVGARFHLQDKEGPNILFFHGNGEIVSDYDDLGPMYNQLGINFLPVDYRGYGRSNGEPSVAGMMKDCHAIFNFVLGWLQDNAHTGPLIVMGRSLGSASALELAENRKKDMDALIIESGFAMATPLLRLLGINAEAIGFSEEQGFQNIHKIQTFDKPTVIIHAEYDHIIPFSDGQALFDACPAPDKTLIRIAGANHNDILFRGLSEYMGGIQELIQRLPDD